MHRSEGECSHVITTRVRHPLVGVSTMDRRPLITSSSPVMAVSIVRQTLLLSVRTTMDLLNQQRTLHETPKS
jgi:hypothetical protein